MKLILPLIASAAAWRDVDSEAGTWAENNMGRMCETHNIQAEACFDRGFGGASGCITFTQEECGYVTISGTINIPQSTGNQKHGWHVHQYGNTVDGCGPDYTGGHFDPYHVGFGKSGIAHFKGST